MKKALIIQYPSLSHLNAAFGVADVLKTIGYEVHYFIEEKMIDYVENHGHKTFRSDSIPIVEDYDKDTLNRLKIKYNYFDKLKDGVTKQLFEHRKIELYKAVDKISPNIILADTFAGADFCLLYSILKFHNIRFFYLETMLSSIETKGIPYLTSKAFPENTLTIYIEQIVRYYKKRIKRLWKYIFYLGYDNYSLLQKEIKDQKINRSYEFDTSNYMDLAFKNIPAFITAPIELEFFYFPQNPLRFNLGFFINQKSNTVIHADPSLKQLLQDQRQIIYISFGTVFGERKLSTIIRFMKKLNNVITKMNNICAIFSLGKALWSITDIQGLTSINTFKFLPQMLVLQHCDLFITHGGLNSIKESIDKTVPMLVYPLGIDQIGNARKIAHKKLGLIGDINTDSETEIMNKVNQLLLNEDYKQNIIKFKEKLYCKEIIETVITKVIEQQGVVV